MDAGRLGGFWDSPAAAVILTRVVDRTLRLLRARSAVVVAFDERGERPLVQPGVSDRGRSYACTIAQRVRELGRSLSTARVPRAARAWLGADSVAAYAAVPLRTLSGALVGAIVAFDLDAHEWDELVLEDLEETGGWLFAALESNEQDLRKIAGSPESGVQRVATAASVRVA